jgi:hypothetical protein
MRPAALFALPVLVLLGCSPNLPRLSGDTPADLQHQDPRVRVLAARAAVAEGREDLIPRLIQNLSDEDEAVRLYTAVALRKLTGEDFGYLPHATPRERRQAIERWNRWASRLPEAGEHPESPRAVSGNGGPPGAPAPPASATQAASLHPPPGLPGP